MKMNESKTPAEFTTDEYDEEIYDLQNFHSFANQVSNNVRGLVNDIATTDLTLEPIVNVSDKIINKVDSLVPVIRESNDHKEKIFNELCAELQRAKIQHERDQNEIKHLKSQILIHSDYCSNVGAVLGNLVWQASLKPEMVNIWLSERRSFKKLEGLVTIIDRVIASFFKTYQDVLPPTNTDEYEFPMGLLGTVSNISVISKGRQFLIDNIDGKSLLKNLVKYFPLIPTDSGDGLKKLILIILWNMCVNADGLRYLMEAQVGQVVLHCLSERNAVKIQALGLQLLQSITLDFPEPGLVDGLLKCVPIETIRRLANDEREDKVAKFARKVLEYLKNYEKIDVPTKKKLLLDF